MKGVKILLGITGGIAAYKSVELCRLLVKEGAEVRTVMTKAATHFVTPLTFETISGWPVALELFSKRKEPALQHITLTDSLSLVIIAPATANFIGKAASAIADDLLTTLILAVKCPILIAPSMNNRMWSNPILQSQLKKLTDTGIYHTIGPKEGELACKVKGIGRMAEPLEIISKAKSLIFNDLKGINILVSAGPTYEDLDPIRFIGNRSSGKMGYAIAKAAYERGAKVIVLAGPSNLPKPYGPTFIEIRSAQNLYNQVLKYQEKVDVIIMAAAVSDFKPEKRLDKKIKKKKEKLQLILEPTPDILAELGVFKGNKKRPLLIGFAAENEDLIKNAKEKLIKKNLDLIIANPIPQAFEKHETKAIILNKDKIIFKSERIPKEELAQIILNQIKGLIKEEVYSNLSKE